MSNRKKHRIFRRFLSSVLAFAMAAGLLPVMGGNLRTVPEVHAAITDNSIINWEGLPEITEVKTSDTKVDGTSIDFTHPGIFASKENLDLMRDMIHQGYDPWFSAFETFREETRASKDYVNTNASRGHTYIGNADRADAGAAYAQIIMWWVTGDKDYYDKAIDIVRSYCESYDPNLFATREPGTSTDGTLNVGGYGWSADIITAGMIIQKLAFTAEILRYATPADTYDNAWTEDDTKDFTELLKMTYPLYDRTDKWMNQTSFTFQALTASAVFQSDADMYALAIERATVNKSAQWNFADGSIAWQARLVDKTVDMDSYNAGENPPKIIDVSTPQVQLAEMGRDQPHAMVGIGVLSGIAQTALIQGTKVNADGVIVTDGGTNLFNFLEDRLLKASNYYFQFNLGYDVPWYPLAKGNTSSYEECPPSVGGSDNSPGWWTTVSHAGRYRLGNAGVLYYYYLYKEGLSKDDPDFKYVVEAQEFSGDLWNDGDSINDAAMLLAPEEAKTGEPQGPPQKKEKPTYDTNTTGFNRIQATDYTGGRAWRAADTNKPSTEYITDEFGTRMVINNTYKDDYIWFKDVDLGEIPLDSYMLTSSSASSSGTLFKLILLDNVGVSDWSNVTRAELDQGEVLVENYSGATSWWNIFNTKTFRMKKELSGTHSFALLYLGSSNVYQLCANLDWMSFGNSYAYEANYIKDAPLKIDVDVTAEGEAVLHDGSIFGYDAMNMDCGNRGLTMDIKSTDVGKLNMYKGTPDGSHELVAAYNIPYTGGKQMTLSILGDQLFTIKGVNDVYYVYEGTADLIISSICSTNITEENIPAVQAENYALIKEGTAAKKTEDDITYMELKNSDIVFYRNMNLNTKLMSFRVRTNGEALLTLTSDMDNNGDISKESIYKSSGILKMNIINTGGKWVTLQYDMTNVTNHSSFVYLMAAGSNVDLDYISFTADNTPPAIESFTYDEPVYSRESDGVSRDYILTGTEYSATVKTFDFDNDPVTTTIRGLGQDYICDENGSIKFSAAQTGDISCTIIADDTKAWTTVKHYVRAFTNLAELIAAVGEYDTSLTYSAATMAVYENALAKANELITGGYTAELVEALQELADAAAQLIPLIPTEQDGTIDYIKYGNKIFFTKWAGGLSADTQTKILSEISALTDGDATTFIEWRPTNTASGQENRAYLGFDFGLGLGVKLDHFDIQTRQGFSSRTQGVVLRGSNDGVNWVVISDAAVNTGNKQTVQIKAEYKNTPFRYIKLVNPKGTDANANNFLSVAEFYIFGQVVSNNIVNINAIKNVHIESNNADPAFAAMGDFGDSTEGNTIILTFEAKEPIGNIAVTINGTSATVSSDDNVHYTAAYTVGKVYTDMPADKVGFSIKYTADITEAPDTTYLIPAVTETSDNSAVRIGKVFKDGEIDVLKEAAAFNANGVANWGSYAGVYNASNLMKALFDLNAVNYIDSSGTASGNLWMSADFGTGKAVEVESIYLASSDDTSAANARWNRVRGAYISGSNDGETWVPVTEKIAEAGVQGQTTWRSANVLDEQKGKAYRYLRLANDDMFGSGYWYGNVTQMMVFGEVINAPAFTSNSVTLVSAGESAFTLELAAEAVEGTIFQVYDDSSLISVTGSAIAAGKELTVALGSAPTEITTFYITMKEPGKAESTATAVTVIPYMEAGDASLNSLTLSKGTLTPTFSPGITYYTVYAGGADSVEILPIPTVSDAAIMVNGDSIAAGMPKSLQLLEGDNIVTIQVTAKDGISVKAYTIVITRQGTTKAPVFTSNNVTLSSPEENTFRLELTDEGAEGSTFQVYGDSTCTSVTGSAIAVGKELTITLNSTPAEITTFYITMKEPGKVESGAASVTVIPYMESSDANLTSLTVNKGTLLPAFSPNVTNYMVHVGSDNYIEVLAIASDDNATIKVNDIFIVTGSAIGINLSEGENTVNVQVTAQDGITAKSYTIVITRQDASNAPVITNSSVILASSGEKSFGLELAAAPAEGTAFQVYSDSSCTNIAGTATATGKGLTVVLNSVPTEVTVFYITMMEPGKTESGAVSVTVTPYTESSDANLSSLEVSEGILSPAFNPDITNYTVHVGSRSAIDILPMSNESKVIIKVNGVSIAAGKAAGISLSEGENTVDILVTAENGTTKNYRITIIRDRIITPEQPAVPEHPTVPEIPAVTTEKTVLGSGQEAVELTYRSAVEKSKIKIDISMKADNATDISDIIPVVTESLMKKLKDSKITDIDIELQLPDGIQADIELPSDLLKIAAESKKNINISVKDKNNREMYSWNFSGDDLKNSKQDMAQINLALRVSPADKELLKKLYGEDKAPSKANSVLLVDFAHDGMLASQAGVRIYVGDILNANPEDRIFLYHLNEETGKLEALPYGSDYKVDKDGYITVNIVHCSDYVVMTEKANAIQVTSLLNQIKVTPSKKTLYIGGNDSKTEISVNLPGTLEVVKSLKDSTAGSAIGGVTVKYTSSNKKVVTVNSTGKVTATGTGTATISTAVTLYSGEVKVFKSVITVKKPYIIITGSKTALKVGEVYNFKAKAYGLDTEDIVWSTTSKSVVVINKSSGKARAASKGTDYVVAKISGVSVKVKVVVR